MMHRYKHLFAVILLVAVLSIPAAHSACFPASERRALRTDLEPIRLAYGSWDGAIVDNILATILLEEKLGIPAEIIDLAGISDENVIEKLGLGEVDAYMELWGLDDVLDDYIALKTVQNLGPLGFVARLGWYIPDYVANISRSMTSYDAYYFAETVEIFQRETINSSATTGDTLTSLSVADSVDDTLNSDVCNPSNGSATLQDCHDALSALVEQVRETYRLQENNTQLITFWTPPPYWLPLDETIIRNLGLPFNATVIPMLPEEADDVESAIVRNIHEAYAARKPFITYFYKPHSIFSSISGVGLRRVTLPEYTEVCATLGDGYNCDYPAEVVKKVAWAGLKQKNSVAYSFVSQFSYTEYAQQDIVAASVYQNKTLEEATCAWLLNNRAVWESLLPDPDSLVTPTETAPAARITMFTLAGLIVLICLIMGLMTWHFRRIRIIQSASPTYLLLILFGAVMSMLWIFLDYSDDPSTAQCTARVWMRHLGFSIMFSALFLKTYRIARVFKATVTKSSPLNDRRLFYHFLQMNAVVILILIIWTVVNPPHAEQLISGNESYLVCNINWWDNAMYILEVVALGGLAVVCFSVRKAPSAFNESKFIALSVYNWLVVAVILQIILRATKGNATFFFIIESLEVLLTVPIIVGLLLVPKLYLTLKGKGGEVSTSSYRANSTPRQHNHTPSGEPSSAKQRRDIEMSSGNGSDTAGEQNNSPKRSSSIEPAPAPSSKADLKEMNALRTENARLLKETEAMRLQLMRMNNPHASS
ncbi:hypothetical protein CAOG_05416 [Capsaspora owczarzaki ATCC 30864]|uniref:G-protein coupled receptors family 3 profile domain-containing protein n=1 Tax=Capsaspora owczarzaki (strain ATCC 30864) TaxID=595528 RepID=A0A0D2WRZ4_CAPO3|nr:hypothetical protein CAOG_05416 [Capsaspora owczarzaki ATCC 30864]KJE94845.1 hypothetical protein CAOG_005416 [Capsaspora owczarzaki ATCC 30864]|eukprot:XP_004346089.2 hypothetical protein CAOG_05416 [Capsaspora owczarzaki ATCC 30864]